MAAINEKVRIYITPTNSCNLDCRCPNPTLPYRHFLTPDVIRRLIDEINDDDLFEKVLVWSEFGESFLHKDNLDFLTYAKKKGLTLYLLTNLTTQSSEELMILASVLSNEDTICLNLDWGAKIYERIRKNSNYEKKLSSVMRLISLNKDKELTDRFRIEIWSIDYDIVTDDDRKAFYEEIQSISELYGFTYRIENDASMHNTEQPDVYFFHRRESKWNDFAFINGEPVCTGLSAPQMHVHASGYVCICCHDWRAKARIGNVYKQSLGQIWESESRKRLHEDIKMKTVQHSICRRCLWLDTGYVNMKNQGKSIETNQKRNINFLSSPVLAKKEEWRGIISTYVRTFNQSDPVNMILTQDEESDLNMAYLHIEEIIRDEGFLPERMADITLTFAPLNSEKWKELISICDVFIPTRGEEEIEQILMARRHGLEILLTISPENFLGFLTPKL